MQNSTEMQNEQKETDYTDFFLLANKHIQETNYTRGLSIDTLNHFNVGFIENWKHPKAPKMTASPRLIIPTSKYSYLARHASSEDYIDYQGKAQNKSKVGKQRIFNVEEISKGAGVIFIVEGEIDAMSVVEVGYRAVGLGSKGYFKKFLDYVAKTRPQVFFIVALDNDGTAEKETQEILDGLELMNISCITANISGNYKDPNEFLMNDKDGFSDAVMTSFIKGVEQFTERMEEEKSELKKEAVSSYLSDFMNDIKKSKTANCYSTGFKEVDALLDGGLYAGLYILGAISSLGKTSLMLQIADNIAKQGQDVLYFSLEMARNELIAKSISRLTLYHCLINEKDRRNAKTTRGILSGAKYTNYNRQELDLITQSLENYKEYAKNIYITEGVGDISIKEIKNKIERYIKINHKAPVVFIDYLQILAPYDLKMTDKQNTDKSVLELKRLSRDYEIPIFAISSFNRENYNEPVSMKSFKESGAIEYSSDVLIGLQYKDMDYQDGEKQPQRLERIAKIIKEVNKRAKEGQDIEIELKVLKNRNGQRGKTEIKYYPMFNYFEDILKDDCLEQVDESKEEDEEEIPLQKF